ncbi:MAG: flavoprotein [Candidatus Omnitrophota bacterium]|nr:flavoprotein [Candidatus Omnitrophota bacterium]
MAKSKEVILGITASIAIYKSCDILRRLKGLGFCVRVVMTQEAEELIRPVVFQSLSGDKVYRGSLFTEPDACKLENNGLPSNRQSQEIEHVSLADQADLVLVAPATANIIAKIASGICDDLLSCVICATDAPVLIAPAMNEGMYRNKITQGNIKKLKSLGYRFVGPKRGKLACGNKGIGCLAEVETIIKEVKKIL